MDHFSSYCVSLCYWAECFLLFLILNGSWSLPVATTAHERRSWTDPRPVPAGSQTHPEVGIRRRGQRRWGSRECRHALRRWVRAGPQPAATPLWLAARVLDSQQPHKESIPQLLWWTWPAKDSRDESCGLKSDSVSEVSACFSITFPLNS